MNFEKTIKIYLIIVLAIIALFFVFTFPAHALTGMIGATDLTGGESGDLDWYDGSTLNDGDVAIVAKDGFTYIYRLNATSTTETESSPSLIVPDSNGGTTSGAWKRWELQEVATGATITTLPTTDATPTVLVGSKFLTADTTTITDFDDGYTGKIITIIAEHQVVITDGTNIFVKTGGNLTLEATDTLTLIQKADGKWYQLAHSDNT